MYKKINTKFTFLLASLFSFNTLSAFSLPYLSSQNNLEKQNILLAENDGYREHSYENENDSHSESHDWKNHYHIIKAINLKTNGNLKVKFCEKTELLEGSISINNIKYSVDDSYKINKKSIVWKLNEKNTFTKGQSLEVNTSNFLGRPKEKSPNDNEIRSLERGCGIAYALIPKNVVVKQSDSFNPIIGLALLVGIGLAAGGSGAGGTSSN